MLRLIRNLAGVFSGKGLVENRGRCPNISDLGFIPGPIDVVLNSEGRISHIGNALGNNTNSTFDGSGLYATAGFVDPHTHALFYGNRYREYFQRWAGKSYREISDSGGGIHNTVEELESQTDSTLMMELECNLQKMLQGGATRVEVKSGYGRTASSEIRFLRLIKNLCQKKNLPDISSTFLGLHALPKDRTETEFVDEMISALEVISHENLAENVDAFPELGFFSLEESLRFATSAKKFNLGLKIHADEISDMNAASSFVSLGARSIDHLQKINSSSLSLLAKSETVATFLPATSFYLGIDYVQARKIVDAGARFALGSDFNPGTAPEFSLGFTQFLAASQLHLTAAEIFSASTYGAAAACGVETTEGALLPNYQGNILLWKLSGKSPEDYIQEMIITQARPFQVIHHGNPISFPSSH